MADYITQLYDKDGNLVNPKTTPDAIKLNDTFTLADKLNNNFVDLSNFPKLETDLDDTERIQRAINYCILNKKNLSLPTNTYYVSQVNITAGITILGNNSLIKKPNLSIEPYNKTVEQMKWIRMFNVTFSSELDQNVYLHDLNFDGSCWDMWTIEDGYAQEQASMLMVSGGSNIGRINILIENCSFINNVSDGIHIHTNVNANIINCRSKDCFRGGLTITGGNSDVNVNNFIFQSDQLPDGIDMEVDSRGYNGSYICNANFNNIIIDKDLDISVNQNSIVNLNNVIMKNSSFHFSSSGNLTVSNSRLINKNTNLVAALTCNINFNNCIIETIDGTGCAINIQFYNSPVGKVKFYQCEFRNCEWGIGGSYDPNTDVIISDCIFSETCSSGAIGRSIDGNTNFAPRNLIINNNKFYNPGITLQCFSIFSPCTNIYLQGNDILNSENTGMKFHNPIVIFKDEIYNNGLKISYTLGANPTFYGKRILIVNEDPNTLGLFSSNTEDIAILNDKTKKWQYAGSGVWTKIFDSTETTSE